MSHIDGVKLLQWLKETQARDKELSFCTSNPYHKAKHEHYRYAAEAVITKIESGRFDLQTDDIKDVLWKPFYQLEKAKREDLEAKLAEKEAEVERLNASIEHWAHCYSKLSESKQRLIKQIRNGEEIHFATLDGESNANT